MSVPEEQLLAALAEKFLSGTATADEQEQLHQLYDKWKDDEETVVSETEKAEVLRTEILQSIKERINGRQRTVVPFYKAKIWRIVAAASVVIVTGILLYHLQPISAQKAIVSKDTPTTPSPVVPGKDRATLTLADGTVIDLDSSGAGLLAQQGNTSIINKDGKIIYDPQRTDSREPVYNTVSTPRGGQYQLILPDGTKVWLNATSSLKFPVAFAGDSRLVELTGEAYFEVAGMPGKDGKKMPFKVIIPPQPGETAGGGVEVLGTHFNVMAYREEGAIKTTLLEGAVRFVSGNKTSLLKPGQQSQLTKEGAISVASDVDIEEVMAWKNGKFHFNNADLKMIMRQVARWYDVDVEYKNISSEARLGGIVSRKEDLRQLLNYFEIAGKVHFTIEGRKIIVTQ